MNEQEDSVVIERVWRGPGLGSALVMHHQPTGLSVRPEIGYDAAERHYAELVAELLTKVSAAAASTRETDRERL